MSDQPLVQYASRTDVGMRRAANQDSLTVRLCKEYDEWAQCGHLFVVADGMGGHAVGDLASRICVESLPLAYFKIDAETIPERLNGALTAANRAITDKARENPEFADMGTTCSALVLSPLGAFVGHVGDSRVYRVRNGQIEQLSFDHSLQWEMMRQGKATMDNVDMLHPRNIITRCLGPDPNVRIDLEGPFHVQAGDRFVICSDGLTGHVSDTEIGAVATSLPPTEASGLLVNLANCRGGADNVTVVVVKVDGYPALAGNFVDVKSTAPVVKPPPTPETQKKQSLLSRLALWVFLLFGSFGLVLVALKQVQTGLMLVCGAVILGFIRIIIVTSKEAAAGELRSTASAEKSPVSSTAVPALTAPYQSTTSEVAPQFLRFLAEAQSELTEAATENDWQVDKDLLRSQNQKAVASVQKSKLSEGIGHRAIAIDVLMKELYARTRRS